MVIYTTKNAYFPWWLSFNSQNARLTQKTQTQTIGHCYRSLSMTVMKYAIAIVVHQRVITNYGMKTTALGLVEI